MQNNETKIKTKGDGSLVALAIIMFFVALMTYANIHDNPDNTNPKLNISHFQKNKDLACQTSLGGRTSILVNKQSGYSLYKGEYFKKDDELINIEYCTQIEEEKN